MIPLQPQSTRTDPLFPDTTLFRSDGGSLPDYIRFRAEGEALAIVNSMIVAGEVDYLTNFDAILTGYTTDAVLGPLYSTFQQNHDLDALRSEEHTSELQSLMRISYAVFCLQKKNKYKGHDSLHN